MGYIHTKGGLSIKFYFKFVMKDLIVDASSICMFLVYSIPSISLANILI